MFGKTATWSTPEVAAGFCDVGIPNRDEENSRIGLEISAEKLYQLLVCGAVSVTDFRCLDRASKCRVRTLCLHACAQHLHAVRANETVPWPHAGVQS